MSIPLGRLELLIQSWGYYAKATEMLNNGIKNQHCIRPSRKYEIKLHKKDGIKHQKI
jgi:hypothetical protein